MRKLFLCISLTVAAQLQAQIDPELLRQKPVDTARKSLNMDAVYNRPMMSLQKIPVTLGGYVEANWQNAATDGVSEGHQFQFRRFTVFMASSIYKRIKFLSELEFEDGTKEISLEFASIDAEFHPLLNLRGGIILNPIGSFNQNHDGPKWEFTDRPIASTQLLPATFSNAGFGLYGKKYTGNWMLGYELYLSNGFNSTIIDNPSGKTYLPATKTDPTRFEESFNGEPLLTGKIAVRYGSLGELGLSYMGGVYNKFQEDGIQLDEKRACRVFAVDYNNTLPGLKTFITGELAWIQVNVPGTYIEQYGSRQQGGFVDIVQPMLKRSMMGWEQATLNVALRLEYVDWNRDTFKSTGGEIGDEVWSLMPGLSFRPSSQTVFRFNYRYMRQIDLLGNPPSQTGAYSLGVSSYF